MHSHEDDSRISAWLDGELSAYETRTVEAHLNECATCEELASSFRRMRQALVPELRPEPDPGFIVRFRARRDEMSIAPFWTWRQLALRLFPVALGVLVAAVLSVWIASRSEPDLDVLEREAIGNATVFARSAPEPVLLIALEPFPGEVP